MVSEDKDRCSLGPPGIQLNVLERIMPGAQQGTPGVQLVLEQSQNGVTVAPETVEQDEGRRHQD